MFTNKILGDKVILREKRLEDAHNDYQWESDPELARLDAAPPLNTPFSRYQRDYAEELHSPYSSSCRYAIDTMDGKHIGNCAYYHISERHRETELGIMIGDRDYWDKGYGTDVISTLLSHIFQTTPLTRVYLKTLASNYRAQNCFRKSGFQPYVRMISDGHDFLYMEIYRTQWLTQSKGEAKNDEGSASGNDTSGGPSITPGAQEYGP